MDKPLTTIGRAECIDLPEFSAHAVPARVDTGAKTSALWVSNLVEHDGQLTFTLFDESSEFYSAKPITVATYSQRAVANSTGHVELRYVIKTSVEIAGRKISSSFTLANRATQVYPILIGRNTLRGKFVVDVKLGKPLIAQEQQREASKWAAVGGAPAITGKDKA